MDSTRRAVRLLIVWMLAAGVVLVEARPAEAGIVSILSGLGKAGKAASSAGKAGKAGVAATGAAAGVSLLTDAGGFLRRLAPDPSVRRVAADVDATGGVRVTMDDGSALLVRAPEDIPGLFKDAAGSARSLEIYVADDVLWTHRNRFAALPADATLHVVHRGQSPYRINRRAGAGDWAIAVGNRVEVPYMAPGRFDSVVFRLTRPLQRASIRLIRLEPGARQPLPLAPRHQRARLPDADPVDPGNLATALRRIRGQTAVLTGRVKNGVLEAGSPPVRVPLADIARAAEDADVNLIVAGLNSPLQPGARGVFGRAKRFVDLERAYAAPDLAGFLSELTSTGVLRLSPGTRGDTHVAMTGERYPRAAPADAAAVPAERRPSSSPETGDGLETALHFGHVVHLVHRTQAVEEDYDQRVFVWLPSSIMYLLAANWILGILAHGTAWGWMSGLWPLAPFREHPSRAQWLLLAPLRRLIFYSVFLMLAGGLAAAWLLLLALFVILSTPVIWLWRSGAWIARLVGARSRHPERDVRSP
ncbi:MAG: hypothetical protein AAF458_12720 [Pseudomonadota bacterium]